MHRFARVVVGAATVSLVTFLAAPAVAAAGATPDATRVAIDFNSVASSGNPVWTDLVTAGYAFDGSHFHTMDNPGACAFGGCVSNGTIYIAEEEGGLGQPFTLTKASGGRFSLKKLQLGQLFVSDDGASSSGYPNATSITLTGTKQNGSQLVRSFSPPSTGFATFSLPKSWKRLVSVTFSANGGFAADNITVKQQS